MLVVSQSPGGALSARRLSSSPYSSSKVSSPHPSVSILRNPLSQRSSLLSLSRRSPSGPSAISPTPGGDTPSTSSSVEDVPVFVGDDGVPLEGVIQFDKPPSTFSSKLLSWAKVCFLAGGDMLCLLAFAAVGRFSHGMPVFEVDTLKTADPFVAGWFLSAYFLGGYTEDGRGENGSGKAVSATAKSWACGIPLGIAIRAATSGHIPPMPFILVTMGSTGVLLIAWRALASKLVSNGRSEQPDVYKRGSPFELFELLTSLVRRW